MHCLVAVFFIILDITNWTLVWQVIESPLRLLIFLAVNVIHRIGRQSSLSEIIVIASDLVFLALIVLIVTRHSRIRFHHRNLTYLLQFLILRSMSFQNA